MRQVHWESVKSLAEHEIHALSFPKLDTPDFQLKPDYEHLSQALKNQALLKVVMGGICTARIRLEPNPPPILSILCAF